VCVPSAVLQDKAWREGNSAMNWLWLRCAATASGTSCLQPACGTTVTVAVQLSKALPCVQRPCVHLGFGLPAVWELCTKGKCKFNCASAVL
jgi:hypothetical protein